MEQSVFIRNPLGLHARPAAKIAQRAEAFSCDISLVKKGQRANAKSIISILSLGVTPDEEVTVMAEGEQAAKALEEIVRMLRSLDE